MSPSTQVLDEAPGPGPSAHVGGRLGEEERQDDEEPDGEAEGDHERDGDRAAAHLDRPRRRPRPSRSASASGCRRRASRRAARRRGRTALARSGCGGGSESRGSVAVTIPPSGWRTRDGDRVAAAHHDALHEGLTAVGEARHGAKSSEGRERTGGPGRARRHAGRRAAQARAARSRRFWKRSTWPAVSTMVCLPV